MLKKKRKRKKALSIPRELVKSMSWKLTFLLIWAVLGSLSGLNCSIDGTF